MDNTRPSTHWRSFLNLWVPPLLLCGLFSLFVFYGYGGAFPPGLNHDGAQHGLFALRILNGESLGIYTPEAFGHETGFYYVMSAVFRLHGVSKESIELTATLFGWLGMGLFFWIMWRKTRSTWLALGLSLLWISSSAFILYSRVGWQLITLVPAALWVAAACRFYFDEPGRARFWAIQIGLSAAVTLYTYNGGRAILAFVPLFWLFRCIQTRFARRTLIDAAISLGVFLLVCAPMLFYAATHWQEWNGRASALMGGDGGLSAKIDNLKAALGYFNLSAHGDDFFTDFPVLEGPMRLLWILGIGFALVRLRSYWPELLLFGIFILPGVVTKPSFHRGIGTLPIVYLLTCYFLIAAGRWAGRSWKSEARRPVLIALLGPLVLIQMGAGWKKLYFDKQPFVWGFYPETTVVGRYMHAHPDQRFVVYAGNWPQDALTFLSTTDIKAVGQNFSNYQAYNTPSADGLPEITRDLQNGTIPRPAHILVDPPKIEAFKAALSSIYKVQPGEVLHGREGNDVAQVFLVE